MNKDYQISKGHICWQMLGKVLYEYYESAGQVYRAPEYNCIDINTSQRIGRWFGSLESLAIAFGDIDGLS